MDLSARPLCFWRKAKGPFVGALFVGVALLFCAQGAWAGVGTLTSPTVLQVLAPVAREGMLAALLGNREDLARVALKAQEIEARQPAKADSPRISDDLAAIRAWTATDGLERTTLLRSVARSEPSPVVLRQVRHAQREEPTAQIRRLRRENHYNEVTGLFNYMFHLGSNLLTLNAEGFGRFAIDLLFVWEPFVELSPQDRAALVVYDQYRPEIESARGDTGGLRTTMDRLRARLLRRNAREELACGNWHMRRGLGAEARMAYGRALAIEPGNARARRGEVAALGRLSALYRARIASLEISPQPNLTGEEAEEASNLSRAICAGTQEEARKATTEFRRKFPRSSLVGDAAYAEAALSPASMQQPGRRHTFLAAMDGSKTGGERLLRAYRDSTSANPSAALREAASDLRVDAWVYVLAGRKESRDFPGIETVSGESLHQILVSFGILLPLEWVRRGIQLAISSPLDDSDWRDAAVRFVDTRTSASPEAREVAADLARSCKRRQLYNQARTYHSLANGEQTAYTAKLDQEAAQQLRELAESQTDLTQRRALLDATVRRFPGTKAGRKAKDALAKLDRQGFDLAQVRKYELTSWPDFWLDRGLRLEPRWFDGRVANGEIGDDGVHFRAPEGKTIEFSVRTPFGKTKKRLVPDEKQLAEIRLALQVWQRESAARRRSEAILNRPPILLEVEGAAGPTGLDVFPKLQPISFDQETLPLYRSTLQRD